MLINNIKISTLSLQSQSACNFHQQLCTFAWNCSSVSTVLSGGVSTGSAGCTVAAAAASRSFSETCTRLAFFFAVVDSGVADFLLLVLPALNDKWKFDHHN